MPDNATWEYEHGYVRNEEEQFYGTDDAACHNGLLRITARRHQERTERRYTSSSLQSKQERTGRVSAFVTVLLWQRVVRASCGERFEHFLAPLGAAHAAARCDAPRSPFGLFALRFADRPSIEPVHALVVAVVLLPGVVRAACRRKRFGR